MTALTNFDPRAALPAVGSTVLLEASAGTGKTWTIGSLVCRHVAGGMPLEQMLVITFGRAASQELRERVRGHLRRVHGLLSDPTQPSEDPVVEVLRAGSVGEVAERARRLRDALTHFDSATIATTHQFCQLVLRGLGIAGDTDLRARLVEDLSDLRDEVVDDLYLRGFAGHDAEPAFSREEAGMIARAVTENPHANLEPSDLPGSGPDARRLRFAHGVRRELARRKRRLGVLGFDDLLQELATTLADRSDGLAATRMRERWRLVLVDEFQDTDPVQWQIIDRAFVGHSTVVLIGDPKQAIYGFRGGDVDTYLVAARSADLRQTLVHNHRSDASLVEGLAALLRGAELGSPEIVVHEVESALEGTRLAGPADLPEELLAPVRLRVVPRAEVAGAGADDGNVPIGRVRSVVAADCAAEIARLLTSGLTFENQPLRAGDVAVLAHTRTQLDHVRAALSAIDVRSVIVSSDSIFTTPAAADWLTLLEAMAQSHRTDRVRSVALTDFIGLTAADLDSGGDQLVEEIARTLRTWSELLGRRGVAAILNAAMSAGLDARVLGLVGGERRLTDLRHVAEVLHQRVVVEGDGLASLTTWLRERMRAARQEERTRRLDSDADAVHLATIHASKGLQYPVVLLPFVADRWQPDLHGRPLHFHRDDGRRCLDIGVRDTHRLDRERRHRAEEDGESLRLLYVALTRAQSQVIAWWFPATRNTPASALHRILFGRPPGGGPVPDVVPVPPDHSVRERLQQWASVGAFVLEVVRPSAAPPAPPVQPAPQLSVRAWTRVVDDEWIRTSYSRLTRPLDTGPRGVGPGELVASEPEATPRETDEEVIAPVGASPASSAGLPSPMADLPVGANFGSLVHEVLELADPGAADLHAELRALVVEHRSGWGFLDLDTDLLATALVAVLDTPLGPLLPGSTLRSIGRRDRLCEMDFELPLAGGDGAGRDDGARLGDLAPILRAHLPQHDPVRGLADSLAEPAVGEQALRGYLTGSIDVVHRVGNRFVVVDYKTNWLGPVDEPLTTDQYGPESLREAMGHSTYPLQALLYAVVLHRFLRWRVPAYDPATHLGGVLYLYVRGMAGPDAPVVDGHPSGVFSWQPPVALVLAVSDLLDGVAR